jgi:hypothetical protein
MVKNYNSFIKLNEGNDIIIGLFDLNRIIEEIFSDTKVSSVDTSYVNEDDMTKLLITINNLFYDETNIIHTKFVFYVDDKKRKLVHNYFYYQYDINCNYKRVDFDSIPQLKEKIQLILDDKKFGDDIKILSDLSVTLSTNVNELLKENDINDLSIYSIIYKPIVDQVPCESLTFQFDINIDDIRFIKMIIKKIEDNDYKITFNENDWFNDINIDSLKSIPQTISDMIKKYVK